jgi:hypothetical protein
LSKPSRPIAHVPRIQPDGFEDFEVFRETFLARVDDPVHNEACRSFARFFYELSLLEPGYWPLTWTDHTAHLLRAVLADLRYLQGYLGDLDSGVERESERHEALCRLAARFSEKIGELADELEPEIGAGELTKE